MFSRMPRAEVNGHAVHTWRRVGMTLVAVVMACLLVPSFVPTRAGASELAEPGAYVFAEGGSVYINEGGVSRSLYTPEPYTAYGSLSPNGQLALIENGFELGLYDIHGGSGYRTLLTSVYALGNASFSPDGKSIYYPLVGPSQTEMYKYNISTNSSTQFAHWNKGSWYSEQLDPTVAANGTVLFRANTNPSGEKLSSPQFWTVNGAGEEPKLALEKYAKASSVEEASISPSGTQVAFALEGSLYVSQLNGTEVKTLLKKSGSNDYRTPSWSPSGESLIFVNKRSKTEQAIEADLVKTGVVETLKKTKTSFQFPHWRQASKLTGINVLAYALRPKLYFDASEPWRPLNVESFLSEENGSKEPLNNVCNGEGTCYPLTGPAALNKSRTSKSYIDIAGNYKTEGKASYHSPNSECVTGSLLDCNTGPASSFYYHIVGPHEGYTYIDYWIFYRFNFFSETLPEEVAGNHEGDWESITIAPSTTGETFDFASFSQHSGWYSYLRQVMSCEGENRGSHEEVHKSGSCGSESKPKGLRVSVFPAYGDHANYPEECSELCDQVGGLPERAHDGSEPWGNNEEPEALLELPPLKTESWVDWPGVWGNEAQASPETPPASPGNHSPHFSEPWRSECIKMEEEGSCTLTAKANTLMRDPTSLTARSGLSPLVDSSNLPNSHSRTLGADYYCANWFGGDVQALLCNPNELSHALNTRTLGPTSNLRFLPRHGSRVAAAAGITQAVGPMLSPGQSLLIHGLIHPGTVLFARAQAGKHTIEARYSHLGPGKSMKIEVQRVGKKPEIKLIGPMHRIVKPSLIIRHTR